MNIRITSAPEAHAFATLLGEYLEQAGHRVAWEERRDAEGFGLVFSSAIPDAERQALLDDLAPISPPQRRARLPESVDAELTLADAFPRELLLAVMDEQRLDRARRWFGRAGVICRDMASMALPDDQLHLDEDASLMQEQVLLWLLYRQTGRVYRVLRYLTLDYPLASLERIESLGQTALREGLQILIESDDLVFAAGLREAFHARGFARVEINPLQKSEGGCPPFTLSWNRVPQLADEALLQEIRQTVVERIGEQGIDLRAWPLVPRYDGDESALYYIHLRLPVAAWQAGELPPYFGDHPGRFDFIVETDDSERIAPLLEYIESLQPHALTVIDLQPGERRFILAAPSILRRRSPDIAGLRAVWRKLLDRQLQQPADWPIEEQFRRVEDEIDAIEERFSEPVEIPELITPQLVHLVVPLRAAQVIEARRGRLAVVESPADDAPA